MECKPDMQTTKLSFIRILVVVALALLANGCSARIVVDENGKPLAGVHVVAYYRAEGPRFYTSYYKCIRVEALITGADGHFDFPFFSGNLNPWLFKRTTEIGYFKPGYELEPNQDEFVSPVRMRPFSGDMKRRFSHALLATTAYSMHEQDVHS